MRTFLAALFAAALLSAQTAVFPGAIATDYNLKVAVNGVTALLTANITTGQTSLPVSGCGPVVPNVLITIDSEIMPVSGCSGETLVVGSRGFDGSVASTHSAGAVIYGYVDAWHHNSVKDEIEAIEATLGVNLSNVPSGSAVTFTASATGSTPAFTTTSHDVVIEGDGNSTFGTVSTTALTSSSLIGGTYLSLTGQTSDVTAPATGYAFIDYNKTTGTLNYNLGGAGWTPFSLPGGVNEQTTSYTLVSTDSGHIVAINDASAATATLPSTPPSATWNAWIENIGAGLLTLDPNGLELDGASSSVVLSQYQGIYISTDGSNYFSGRGGPLPGSTISANFPFGNPATLTIRNLAGSIGAAPALVVSSASGATSAILASSTFGLSTGVAAVEGDGGVQFGVKGTTTSGLAGQAGGIFIGGGNYGLGGGADLILGGSGELVSTGTTLASISSAQPGTNNGAMRYAYDAKNYADDGVTVGSVATGGGHGAWVAWVNGSWRTMI